MGSAHQVRSLLTLAVLHYFTGLAEAALGEGTGLKLHKLSVKELKDVCSAVIFQCRITHSLSSCLAWGGRMTTIALVESLVGIVAHETILGSTLDILPCRLLHCNIIVPRLSIILYE